MQEFSGIEYIKIDIANHFGLDKETWNDRIKWVDDNRNILWNIVSDADDPILFIKGLYALEDAENGVPTGFIMGLDSTASGLQIMACLIGCEQTASNVNLVNTGNREDIYSKIANHMQSLGANVTRSDVKKPIMTHYYNSKAQPKSVFGEGTKELDIFYKTLQDELPGAEKCMLKMQSCWNPETLKHSWTLPDGHKSIVKVLEPVDSKIEVDALDHTTFTYRHMTNRPSTNGLSLSANIVHSIDGYIVREMVRKANEQGFQLATIHDSFWSSPNYMNNVRQNYIDILSEIANSNLLINIMSEICGESRYVSKLNPSLDKIIKNAEYALS